MELAITIIGIVLTAAITIFLYRQSRRDKKTDALLELIKQGRLLERMYIRASGNLSRETAEALQREGRCNGEVSEAMKNFKKCESALDKYYQESDIMHTI